VPHVTSPTPASPEPERAVPDWWATTASALDTKMGLEVSELTPQRVVGSMPVEGNTQPYGLWHGGASCVLAETLASIGSFAHAQTVAPGSAAVGVDLNATHHRPARSGRVTGVATALHLGRRTTSYEVVLSDDDGRRVCTARVTCQVVRGEAGERPGGGMGRPATRPSPGAGV
jgi:1,4-dihydroxy-2-naphthoyl-CoA hydrolase